MLNRSKQMVEMARKKYSFRKKKPVNYHLQGSPSLTDLSLESSDGVTTLDLSSASYSSFSTSGADNGFLEVSVEKLKNKKTELNHSNCIESVASNYMEICTEMIPNSTNECEEVHSSIGGFEDSICSDSYSQSLDSSSVSIIAPTTISAAMESPEISYPNEEMRNLTYTQLISCFEQNETESVQQRNAENMLIYPEDETISPKNIKLPDTSTTGTLSKQEKKSENMDRVLANFGNIIQDRELSNIERIENCRRWTKKNNCPYCFMEVTHFPRHLERNHTDEGAVKEIFGMDKQNPKRRILLNSLRRQGNFMLRTQGEKTRPIRRPRQAVENKDYVTCNFCLGIFKKQYLRKHRKKCTLNTNPKNHRENHLSEAQSFLICSGSNKDFYDSLRLKKEVLNKMRADDISKIVMGDVLICSYGESQLKRHKRVQLATMVSNKIRELGRLLITLQQMTGVRRFIDVLKPEFFDNIVTATKIISGYDEEKRSFKAASLALHMSTRLVQVCDIATKLIIKKSPFLKCGDPEPTLKNIKRLRSLISSHWNSEISSLALKDLNEKQWEKPKLLPITSDIMNFEKFVIAESNNACEYIKVAAKNTHTDTKENGKLRLHYRKLSECILALTLLLNRKRIGEIQFLKLKTYQADITSNYQEEIRESLSENEKILTQNFKRVVTGGKGSKPIVVLFPKKIQLLIDVLLSVREKCVPACNEYLFANPNTESRWLSGYHVIKKLADQSGVVNKDLFTSTRLRKQIATVLQVMNITESEMEQFANFMGHTKKTHEEYYRLPQDVYQTAKISKILIAINKGKGALYKGKNLDEIQLSDDVDSDDSDDQCKISIRKKNIENPPKQQNIFKELHNIACSEEKSDVPELPCKSYHDSDSSSNEDQPMQKSAKKKIQRTPWTTEQSREIRTFFSEHIKKKKAPKKHEVQLLMDQQKSLFKNRNWITIKAYVYNCYKNK